MSKLFDDASLAMIPSAYKDGRLYSIRPVQELGGEEVTNGSFDTDSNWTKGTGSTISGGVLSHSGATASDTTQYLSITAKKYRLEYTIVSGSGSVRFWSNINAITPNKQSGAGTYVHYFFYNSSIGTDGRFAIALYDDISIDNVSVKEVLVSGDFDFSRGSNLAATRVDVNGLIEKGRENDVLYSNDFNQWAVKSQVAFTSGHSGYDGSNDAWLMQATSTGSVFAYDTPAINSGIRTRSVYAKAGTQSTITLLWSSFNNNTFATFNLSNGTFTNANCLANIENIGNGWYRCISTITNANNAYPFLIGISNEVNSPISIGDNIYIQDCQQEAGLVATDYIETTTTSVSAGILEDMPRLDYSGGASCPSLLLEPQRSNIITRSEHFGAWSNNISSNIVNVVDNFGVSPEGKQNAAKLTFNGQNSWIGIPLYTITQQTYTGSVYLKVHDGLGNISAKLRIYTTGGGSSEDVSITITDEWQRFDGLFDDWVAGSGSIYFVIRSNTDGRSCLAYGAQLESGSYPTSYIPTYGTSQTRSLDSALDFSSSVNNDSFTFFFEGSFSFADSNFYDMRVLTAGGNHIGYYKGFVPIYNLGSGQNAYGSSLAANTNHKVLFMYDGVNAKFYRNGSLYHSVAASGVGTFVDGLVYNSDQEGLKIKQLLYFPTALTDSECIALTTIA